jgi:hypothetical protein
VSLHRLSDGITEFAMFDPERRPGRLLRQRARAALAWVAPSAGTNRYDAPRARRMWRLQ